MRDELSQRTEAAAEQSNVRAAGDGFSVPFGFSVEFVALSRATIVRGTWNLELSLSEERQYEEERGKIQRSSSSAGSGGGGV